MSEFHINVIQLGKIARHPNADTLSVTHIGGDGGYPVILRTGEFSEGDRAVYVPVGAAVPVADPRWSFLAKPGSTKQYVEIGAKRLRGVFSMGILTSADPSWDVGRDVASDLGILRAEDLEDVGKPASQGHDENVRDPGLMPEYTDIEGLRRYPNVLREGEEVVIVEKIHGQNARYALTNDGDLCVGSRTRWKRPDGSNVWAQVAGRIDLATRLRSVPSVGIYGECYGNVNGMRYDATVVANDLRLFDAMDLKSRRYLDFDAFLDVAKSLSLPIAPVLYRGPWSNDLRKLADGPSTINPSHTREGFVVRPVRERHEHMGRVILKFVGEDYLTRNWSMKR